MLSGINYVTDDQGRTLAVQIDLRKHHALWEDIQDVLVSQSRRKEKSVSLDTVKASLVRDKRQRD